MFEVGDPVVHPAHGAGVVTDIEEMQRRGSSKQYYKIKLLGQARTSLMVPVKAAEARGLRRAIRQSRLNRVWRVLRAAPEKLPAYYKARHKLLESKFRGGDLFQIAEAVRDLAWRQRREQSGLTVGDKRRYKKGIELLAGEIAATQGIEVADAEIQVRARLLSSLSPEKMV